MSQPTINAETPNKTKHNVLTGVVIQRKEEENIFKVIRKGTKEHQGSLWETSSVFCFLHVVLGGVVEMTVSGKPKRVWPSVEIFIQSLKLYYPEIPIVEQ